MLQRAHWDDEAEMWVLERLAATSDPRDALSLFRAAAGSSGGDEAARSSSSRRTTQQQQQQGSFGVMQSSGRPYATPGARRPMSAFTKAALLSGDMNPRFRCVCLARWLSWVQG